MYNRSAVEWLIIDFTFFILTPSLDCTQLITKNSVSGHKAEFWCIHVPDLTAASRDEYKVGVCLTHQITSAQSVRPHGMREERHGMLAVTVIKFRNHF